MRTIIKAILMFSSTVLGFIPQRGPPPEGGLGTESASMGVVSCEGNRGAFNAGWGACSTYAQSKQYNYPWCPYDFDSKQGLTAAAVCHECGCTSECTKASHPAGCTSPDECSCHKETDVFFDPYWHTHNYGSVGKAGCIAGSHDRHPTCALQCAHRAASLGLPFSTQGKSNGAPAGCMKYNNGRVIFVETCNNHPNCGTKNCNGCSVIDDDERFCAAKAQMLGLPFSTQGKSNGAPAGCMKYNDGRVIFVETCNNHPNCGTLNCNGCSVIDDDERFCAAKAQMLGLPFSTQGKSNGAPAGCMKYNDGRVIFVETCTNHPNCGTKNCNGCSVI